ncbi:hypothetical protein [Brevundimonas sp. TWP1-2-1b1]|uniref:hypothetical protein n=1 Tax=unclassified Brevundimonas TaxID=2622653 RepID=UPI003CF96A0F
MKTVTFFRDMDFPVKNGTVAYLQDNTYPHVPDDVVAMMLDLGVGEVVPDDILADPDDLADDYFEPPVTKVTRTTMRKRWKTKA